MNGNHPKEETMTSWTIIYRTGGTENFQWHKSIAYLSKEEAAVSMKELERMGYAALMHTTRLLESIGLPETYSATDQIQHDGR